jgi:hypothetical protein
MIAAAAWFSRVGVLWLMIEALWLLVIEAAEVFSIFSRKMEK